MEFLKDLRKGRRESMDYFNGMEARNYINDLMEWLFGR